MNRKIILMPLSKKNEEGINSKLSNNHLFIIVSDKSFVKEKGTDILRLVFAGYPIHKML